eukprot:263304_1
MAVTAADWILSIFMLCYSASNLPRYLWYCGFKKRIDHAEMNGRLPLYPLCIKKNGFLASAPNWWLQFHVAFSVGLCIFWSLLLLESIKPVKPS